MAEKKREFEEHTVLLPMKVNANSYQTAVEDFIQQINQYGLRSWHYTVQRSGEDNAVTVKGSGELVGIFEPQEQEQGDEPEDVSPAEELNG